jgi:hypothetical protein
MTNCCEKGRLLSTKDHIYTACSLVAAAAAGAATADSKMPSADGPYHDDKVRATPFGSF